MWLDLFRSRFARLGAVAILCLAATGLGDANAQVVNGVDVGSILQSLQNGTPITTTGAPPVTTAPPVTSSTTVLQPATPPSAAQLPPSRLELLYSARAGRPLQQFGYGLFGVGGPVTVSQIGGVQDNYVLGPGDQISVVNRGHDNNSYVVPVDRDGRVILPNYAPVMAGGRTFGEFRRDLTTEIQKESLNTRSFITLAAARQITVLVSGEVQVPGARTLSGLNTPLDALMLSGGIRKNGSLRNVIIERGTDRRRIDLYALAINGDMAALGALTEGDHIIVPPIGATVAVIGLVKRPAIYELAGGATAIDGQALIRLAGGNEIAGANRLSKIALLSNGSTQLITLGHDGPVHSGEILSVDQQQNASLGNVTLEGAVSLPGTRPLVGAPSLSRLLHDSNDLTPDAYTLFGIVVHRNLKSNAKNIVAFSLKNVFDGREDYKLANDDVVYIFTTAQIQVLASTAATNLGMIVQTNTSVPTAPQSGQNSSNSSQQQTQNSSQSSSTSQTLPPSVISSLPPNVQALAAAQGLPGGQGQIPLGTQPASSAPIGTSGQAIAPTTNVQGAPPQTTGMAGQPIVPSAGGQMSGPPQQPFNPQLAAAETQISPSAAASLEAQNLANGGQSMGGGLITSSAFGVAAPPLTPDGIAAALGLPTQQLVRFTTDYLVWVLGEARNPGAYLVQQGTSLAALLEAAGGANLQADLSWVEVTSTDFDTLAGTSKTTRNAYKGRGDDFEKVLMRPLDVVRLRQVFSDRTAGNVTVNGQVRFPGTYDITRGEKLSSLLLRAGGLTDEAYAYGAVFTRPSAAAAEALGNQREAASLESAITIVAAQPTTISASITYLETLAQQLRQQPTLGRVTVTADPSVLAVKPDLDVILQPGDAVFIPSRPSSVAVSGEVLNPGAFQYKPDLTADDYVNLAGGPTQAADTSSTFIIYPDGTARPLSSNWISFLDNTPIPPGSTVVVPHDPIPFVWPVFLSEVADIGSKLAIAAASLAVISQHN